METLTDNPGQTKEIGKRLAQKLLKTPTRKKAIILGLEGDLGGGKTTFLKGFARGLGIKKKILSPTFVIMKNFRIPKNTKFKNFYHFDCYRILKPKEILNLGFKKIVNHPENIIAIEWADRVRKILPKDIAFLKFKFISKNKRRIKLNKNGQKIFQFKR